MHLNPQKSREAHSQIRRAFPVAASCLIPGRCSVAPGAASATIPSQHPVRGADAGQPFPEAPGGVIGAPLRRSRQSAGIHPGFASIDQRLSARLSGPAFHVVIEPIHDHPQARMLINLIGFAVLFLGIAIQFA